VNTDKNVRAQLLERAAFTSEALSWSHSSMRWADDEKKPFEAIYLAEVNILVRSWA